MKSGPLDEATVVELLEDREEQRRYLAAVALEAAGHAYRTDPGLAARMLGVAQRERSSPVIYTLGLALSRIDLGVTGAADALANAAFRGLRDARTCQGRPAEVITRDHRAAGSRAPALGLQRRPRPAGRLPLSADP